MISLNYSGILLNPFEFYSEDLRKVEEDISQIFQECFFKFKPNAKKADFNWGIGKIDQKLQK